MRKLELFVISAIVLVSAAAALAIPKHRHNFGAIIGPGATGQPGQLPSQVFAPGIAGQQAYFVYDGGPSAIPPVQDIPIFAPAFFIGGSAGIGGYGVVTAISGLDGGPVPGVLFQEVGTVISGGGTVATNTQRNFSPWDGGVGLAAATCAATPIVCSGNGGCTATCVATTDGGVTQVNITSDGGLWRYDLLGTTTSMRSLAVQQIALAVRQRADLSGQQNAFGGNAGGFIIDPELLTDINSSVAMVWDKLVEKFPENYAYGYDGNPSGIGYIFPIQQGTYQYNLPFDFYKEKGVDLSLDASLQNWSTMRPYTLRDRNLFSYPLQTTLAYAGWQNMRWNINTRQPGQLPQISFLPKQGPLPGTVRLLYATAAPILCYPLPAARANSTAYAANALIYVPVTLETGLTVNQVYCAINGGTSASSAPSFPVPGVVEDGNILWAYQGPQSLFTATLDGINGYEDLVILDAAIKTGVKEETDVSAMMAQKAEWMERIDYAAANRNSGDPMPISGGFGLSEGGGYASGGFGPFGGMP